MRNAVTVKEELIKEIPHKDCAEDAPSDFSSECIRRPKEVPLGYDRRNTDVFQGSFVYYDGKYANRFGAGCRQYTKKSSRKAQTDWIVLQMPLGYLQAVFVWCCLKSSAILCRRIFRQIALIMLDLRQYSERFRRSELPDQAKDGLLRIFRCVQVRCCLISISLTECCLTVNPFRYQTMTYIKEMGIVLKKLDMESGTWYN